MPKLGRDRPITLEICVETPQGLEACKGLADRIELCSALDLGGLTPSFGLMQAARDSGLETHVLIRPRPGSFTLHPAELDLALRDIEALRALGLHGVVIGALRDGALDQAALRPLIDAASGLQVTLHRAVDVVADQGAALETAIELGFTRILTSGGQASAIEGFSRIKALCAQAAGRIEIMAGGGITADRVAPLVGIGLDALHASCTTQHPVPQDHIDKGFGRTERHPSRDKIQSLYNAVKGKPRPD